MRFYVKKHFKIKKWIKIKDDVQFYLFTIITINESLVLIIFLHFITLILYIFYTKNI